LEETLIRKCSLSLRQRNLRLKSQLYLRTLGFTINDVLISGMIRKGLLTRSQGLARVEIENVELPDFVAQVSKEVGIKIDLTAFGSHF
jgi:hypothetical protein